MFTPSLPVLTTVGYTSKFWDSLLKNIQILDPFSKKIHGVRISEFQIEKWGTQEKLS